MSDSRIFTAEGFAKGVHLNQKYGNKPYYEHLEDVVRVLRRSGFFDNNVVLSAGWLHDCIEDQGVTEEQLTNEFGSEVAKLVVAVTDAPGSNRKERKAATYPKIRAAGKWAIAIKLADRIANVGRCRYDSSKSDLLEMYRAEQEEFKSQLYIGGMLEDMWAALELHWSCASL
jgi:guanosine-3',5'-bis(diphosphate) 3'-pyrophosphohydrolase